MNQNRLAVVIVNYKTPKLVMDAVASLAEQIDKTQDVIIIVDNNSGDGSTVTMQNAIEKNEWTAFTKVIQASKNGGFSYGNNLGIRAVNADYYFLLNSDAYVLPDCVEFLLETVTGSSIGAVSPRLLWENGEQQVSLFNNMTPATELVTSAKTGVITQFMKKVGVFEIAINSSLYNESVKFDWASFAAILIKKEAIESVGLLDETYFMYREDNDYCRRLINKGWEIAYQSKANVVHLNQGHSNKLRIRKPEFYYYSRSYYFKKYYGVIGLLVANLMWSIGRTVSQTRELFSNKKFDIARYSLVDIWKGFFK